MKKAETVKVYIEDEEGSEKMKYQDRTAKIIDISFNTSVELEDNPKTNFRYRLRFKDGEEPNLCFRRKELMSIDEAQLRSDL